MDASDYEALGQLVLTKSGLKLDPSRTSETAQIIAQMTQTAGQSSFVGLMGYLRTLDTSHPIWQMLLRRVTIGETYFFRNSPQFQVIQNTVLPEIIRKRRASDFHVINIWSAGCATGEEPYSLAIAVREALPDIENWTINILGTDINDASLETARQGIYRSNSFRSETRGDIQSRYFTQKGKDFELDPEIRHMVSFMNLNLITGDYPAFHTRTVHQDIIVCRNVTIYFELETTRQVVSRFYRCLSDGGWLIVGHAEPQAIVYQDFAVRNFESAILYQKETVPYVFPVMPPNDNQAVVLNQAPAPIIERPKAPIPTFTSSVKPRTPEINPPSTRVSASSNGSTAQKPVEKKPEPATIQQARDVVDKEDWVSALQLLDELEQQYTTEPEIHYLRALVLMHTGELDSARVALRRSIYCDPSFALSHYTMGEIYAQLNKPKEAQRAWILAQRAVAKLSPEALITPSEDLTVEMFRHLLEMRIANTNTSVR